MVVSAMKGQTEVKSQVQLLLGVLTDWKVMYIGIEVRHSSFPRVFPIHLSGEASLALSSPSHSTFSSPRSPPRLGITQL